MAVKKSTAKAKKTASKKNKYQLRLYVAGQSPKSTAAVSNLKKLCETHLKGQYSIQIIDLLKNPRLAKGDQILAIPTLVRSVPEPVKRMLGDLSDSEKFLVGFDLK